MRNSNSSTQFWSSSWRSPALAALALALTATPAAALTYTYDNTTSGTIPELGTNALCNGGTSLVRTFTVTDSFTVSSIALGLNLTHGTRGQIRAILNAPGGSSAVFVAQTGAAGDDPDDNYDILISTNSEGGLDDGDADPTAEPHYNRLVNLAGANFFSGNANGTWTLRVCDRFSDGTGLGTFNRARLVLESATAAAASCTGTLTFDWGANGHSNAFINTTVGDITVTQGTTTDFGGTVTADGFNTLTTTNGGHPGYYGLVMDASIIGGAQDNEAVGLLNVFNFSRPVRDLAFTLLDVDLAGGAWEDQIFILGFNSSGATVPYSRTFLGAAAQPAGNIGEGDSTATNPQTIGNIAYVFEGGVDSITMYYTQGSDPAADNNQMVIGISDLTFCGYDYGDAPNTYGTQLAGGARHALGDRSLYLGTNPPDGESNGQPAAAATTDDTTQVGGVDDEDGVASFPNYVGGSTTYTVSVTANNRSTTTAASLVGYIDWNRDGDFNEANERSATTNVPANTVNGAVNVTWNSVPANAGGTTSTYARFRIAFVAAEVTSPTGLATSGEVEDYPIATGTLPVTLASFHAERTKQGLAVSWSTETETATVGYRVLAGTANGWEPLSRDLTPTASIDTLEPQRYSVILPDGKWRYLAIEDWSTTGEPTMHGPFEIGQRYGGDTPARPIDWLAVATELEAYTADEAGFGDKALSTGFPVVELGVSETGIYRLTYEQLLAAGFDFGGAPLAQIAVSKAREGKEIPLYVESGTGTPSPFGPGGYIEFRGEAVTGSLYTRTRNYRLEVKSLAAARARVLAAVPNGAPVASYEEKQKTNRDREYSFASPNGDPWYEAPVLAQSTAAERTFTISADAVAEAQGRLKLSLWGVTDWPGEAPDHHLEILWNGTRLTEDRFDGLVARDYDLPLPAGTLADGDHQLTVRVLGDTGFTFDLVHVDRYTLVYPRAFEARESRLTFPGTNGRLEVDGFASANVVAWAGNGRYRLRSFSVAPSSNGFEARLTLPAVATGGAPVELSTVEALRVPTLRAARQVPADLLTGSARSVIVTHGSFAAALPPLVAAQQGRGWTVKVVDVADLYAKYSGGEVDPEAIRLYVVAAAIRLGARAVTLIGGDTYDYANNLGLGTVSFIPTPYAASDELIRFTPADSIYGDLDGDGVQDLAVGRLPARTVAELESLIEKTLAFPQTPGRAVLAADSESEQLFTGISEDFADLLPDSWPVARAYVDTQGVAAARQQLLGGFNEGAALVSYVGHSGPTVWSFQGLFSAADAETLGNAGWPSVVVQWGCWNTYHVSPRYDTLAHRLLLAGNRGAATVVGSSTLSKTSSDQRLGPELMSRLMSPGKSVGEAMVEAKRAVAAQGGDVRDVLLGWTILGDPTQIVVP